MIKYEKYFLHPRQWTSLFRTFRAVDLLYIKQMIINLPSINLHCDFNKFLDKMQLIGNSPTFSHKLPPLTIVRTHPWIFYGYENFIIKFNVIWKPRYSSSKLHVYILHVFSMAWDRICVCVIKFISKFLSTQVQEKWVSRFS